MKYKNLFFDLDDTLWAFSENTHDTFREMYVKYSFDRYFDSFEHYYELYQSYNLILWEKYTHKQITRDELNQGRFSHPLIAVGVNDEKLVNSYMDNFFETIHTKNKTMPYTKEILEYLKPKYNLYIITNGFKELQPRKMEAAGIAGYFKKVILSGDIGILKPHPEIFHFALSATQSNLKDSLMIGDSWDADITGASNAGMDQMFYNVKKTEQLPFRPTYVIENLREIKGYL